ncbi:hypothetical protein [Leptospira sp. GIMC2001]|uniref:hypothetical protein n=1 Tax=Leptospira sp. GIMC2001 TaxID=1513297 RepID=UPI00234AF1EE|nr:hypothetical protein [Leptospira sp. GIMC2001]WCL49782.1 hypothetical protein O4O04_02890 [Leptospira sp. GIMC2001]
MAKGVTVIFEGIKSGVTLNAYKGTRCEFTDGTSSALASRDLIQVTLGEGRSFTVSNSGDYFFVASSVGSTETTLITNITVRK